MPSVPINFLHPDCAKDRATGRLPGTAGSGVIAPKSSSELAGHMWYLLLFMAILRWQTIHIWDTRFDLKFQRFRSQLPTATSASKSAFFWLFLGVWIDLLSSLLPECKLWQTGQPGEPTRHIDTRSPSRSVMEKFGKTPEPPRKKILWGWKKITSNRNPQTVGFPYPCWFSSRLPFHNFGQYPLVNSYRPWQSSGLED